MRLPRNTKTQTNPASVENKQKSIDFDFLFCCYAEQGQLGIMQQLRDCISNINYQIPGLQRTALIAATCKGHVAVVSYLLEQKADMTLHDSQKMTALGYAVYNGNADVVKIFLDMGLTADFLATPLGEDAFTVLNIAADKGHHLIVQQLLDKKMDPNCSGSDGVPPLHRTIQLNRFVVAELLINNPRTQLNLFAGKPQRTPIILAILLNRRHLVELLLKNPRVDKTVTDKKGITLCELAFLTHDDLFKLLIKYDYDLNHKNHYDETTLHHLVHWEKLALIEWLLAEKAHAIKLDTIPWAVFLGILRENKTIVLLLLNKFFSAMQQDDLFSLAEFAITKGWFDIALKLAPEMRLVLNSPILRNHPRVNARYILTIAEYLKNPTLEFNLFIAHLNIVTKCRPASLQSQTSTLIISPVEHLGIGLSKMPPSELLNITATIPGMAASLDEAKHDRAAFMQFLFPPVVFSQVLSPQIIVGARVCGISPMTWFAQQGRAPAEIKTLMSHKNDKPPQSNLFVVKHAVEQQPAIKACSWFDGLLSSADPRLLAVDDATKKNVRLLIPTALGAQPDAKKLLQKSRWRFNDKNGIKPIKDSKGFHSVTVEIKIDDTPISLTGIHFTHEITTPSSADRILCFQLTTRGGSLFIAAHFLKHGLHHALPHFPKKIKLVIPPIPCQMSEQQQSQALVF